MPTVLVVEDHDDFRESLLDLLHLEGWTAIGAKDANMAVDIAKGSQIDVVLTDVLLPGGSGHTLEEVFRTEPGLTGIPFVFMSGSALHLDAVCADRSLLKPFTMDRLRDILAAVGAPPGDAVVRPK
jgi:CheY-like chemotaxis protein